MSPFDHGHTHKEPPMLARLVRRVLGAGRAALSALRRRVSAATKPAAPVLMAGALADLRRSKPELVAENALLRQQLLVLRRSVTRPRCTPADRTLLVLLASRVRAWCRLSLSSGSVAELVIAPRPHLGDNAPGVLSSRGRDHHAHQHLRS
jgi:hypothetical protein